MPAKRAKRKQPEWQQQLFFQRLRSHAKWAYALLALLFLLTFALLGVGSGSNGLSSALQNAFSFGGGGADVKSLQQKALAHPTSPKAWRNLATAQEQKQDTAGAVDSLTHLAKLRPKDTGVLQELASEQTQLVSSYQSDVSSAAAVGGLATSAASFAPPSSTPIGKTLSSTADPITSAVSQTASQRQSDAQLKAASAGLAALATYRRLAALTPNDATAQIQLAEAAQAANDTQTAVAAYKRFLKLAPTDPLVPNVKKVLKSLHAG